MCASSIYGVDFLIVRDRREKIAQDTASLNWLMQLMSRCKEAAEAAPFSSPSLSRATAAAAAFVPGFQRALIDATYVYMLRIRRQLQAESSRYLASTTEDDRQLYYIHTYIYIYTCCCWGNCSAIL